MRTFLIGTSIAALGLILMAPAAQAGQQYRKVKGEVIKVEQHVRTQNGGEFDRLTIRTRQGEEMQLNLGKGGACEGCFEAGDRVRARVQSSDGSGGAHGVQSLQVRRGGEMFSYANQGGALTRGSGKGHGRGGGGSGHHGGSGSGGSQRSGGGRGGR